jgi:hypothetical protein
MKAIGAVVLGAMLVVSPLAGQWRGHVQAGGGVAVSTGVFKEDGGKTGWLAQVAGGLMSPGGIIGARINGTFAKHNFASGTGSFKILGAMGDILVSPKMSGKLGGYALAGAGFQNMKAGEAKQTKFAWNAGAGVLVKAGSLGIFLEGRFLSINTENQKTNTIPITAGVRFGGN